MYCGYKLVGVLSFEGRRLPDDVECGVCRLKWSVAASPWECAHCHSARVADWQKMKSGVVIQPGALVVAESVELGIVTSVDRIKRRVALVAFVDDAPTKLTLDARQLKDCYVDDPRLARFSNYALCPNCNRVFSVQIWGDVDCDELKAHQAQSELSLARAREEKARLKREAPHHYADILDATADIHRHLADVQDLRRRLCEPQLWCPFCLCHDFHLS